ncbi:MAG: deoxyribodipyrimidine photolyase, partial [Rhodospirillaceae bacterium BRH_c57]
MTNRPVLVWFRNDLRIDDHPALRAAADSERPVAAVYVLDDALDGRPLGGAARWWLHHSLVRLRDNLGSLGVPLVLRRGPAADVIPALAAEAGAAT